MYEKAAYFPELDPAQEPYIIAPWLHYSSLYLSPNHCKLFIFIHIPPTSGVNSSLKVTPVLNRRSEHLAHRRFPKRGSKAEQVENVASPGASESWVITGRLNGER